MATIAEVSAKVSCVSLASIAISGVIMTATATAVELHGHRGARGLLPENTIAGFQEAVRLGVDCIETDVGLSRDGELIIHHDRSLNVDIARLDGSWIKAPVPLFSLRAREIQAYDVGRIRPGSDYAGRYPKQRARDGTPIPLLRDLLTMPEIQQAPGICLNIEIKTSPLAKDETAAPKEIVGALVGLLDQFNFRKRVRVQSFDWRNLVHLREIAPDVTTGFLTAEQSWLDNLQRRQPGNSPWLGGGDLDAFDGSVADLIRHMGGTYWLPYYKDISAPDVEASHARGLKVVVWTVNEADAMADLIGMGVDGIITDYPDVGRNIINRTRNMK